MRIADRARTLAKLVLTVAVVTFAVHIPQLLSPEAVPAASTARIAPPPMETAPAPATPTVRLASAAAPADPAFLVRGVLELDRPLSHGDYAWDDEGVPAGKLGILVNIAEQTIHVYRAGIEIGRASILYGADEKPTPLGLFKITEKDADHVSNIYNAPMPHMLRLTNDGIAIHGSHVRYGWATNGCVGVPEEFAALLFSQVKLGDQVLIVNEPQSEEQPQAPTAV